MEASVNQPESEPNDDVEVIHTRRGSSLIWILLLIIAIVVAAAVGWLAVRRLWPGQPAAGPASTPTAATQPAATATPAGGEPATPTATRVGQVEATPAPSPTPKLAATETTSVVEEISEPFVSERVRNGGFEAGFEDFRVGLGWTSFDNGSAIFEFLDETWPPAVLDGKHAQRIQVREASQPDRYAGIYQTVNVVPGAEYTLTLHGQIRSGQGDIQISQYGYRMQLGIDYEGGQDWKAVDNWIELPWDEQRFDSDFLFFYDYVTPVVASGPRLTLFIRTWNKWADPGRVEYTLDGISLVGAAPSTEIAVDKPLPATGQAPTSLSSQARLAASVLILGLLVAGAVWQVRRQKT